MAGPDVTPNPLVKKLAAVGGHRVGTRPDAVAQQGLEDVPELTTFAGYFAGEVADPSNPRGGKWALLFLDVKLSNWLIVEPGGLVHRETYTDPDAREANRDVIWVKAHAIIKRGSGPQSPESRFLRGEFTRAQDFDASPAGGTFSRATGIFCDAQTPGCCGPRTRPR